MLSLRRGAPPSGRTTFALAVLGLGLMLFAPLGAQAQTSSWQSGFASIVLDAKTGRVIQATNADTLRHPASLAKVMTLYLLFAELEAGRLSLDTRMKVSAEAAAQPPSKLGVKAGSTIRVKDAIKALVTRSANDVAVVIAEAISGDEAAFARLMTHRARALGMPRTVFKNPHGLPDREQVTTAREMATLGIAIQDRFPKYYSYFSTRGFRWGKTTIGNHNRLLGSVTGVDGIKTGYTRASGFNLLTNVKRDNRHMVAVVLGGKTAASRNAHMRKLIADNIRQASTGPRTLAHFHEAPPLPLPNPIVSAAVRPPEPRPGSGDPIHPTPVRIVTIEKSGQVVAEGDKDDKDGSDVLAVSTLSDDGTNEPMRIAPPIPTALARNGKVVTFADPPLIVSAVPSASAQTSPEVSRGSMMTAYAPRTAPSAEPDAAPAATPPASGWVIQIGAFTDIQQAHERLAAARKRVSGVLAKASPYTEKTKRGSTEYIRARFAGFDDSSSARRACEVLKKNDFACFAVRN